MSGYHTRNIHARGAPGQPCSKLRRPSAYRLPLLGVPHRVAPASLCGTPLPGPALAAGSEAGPRVACDLSGWTRSHRP